MPDIAALADEALQAVSDLSAAAASNDHAGATSACERAVPAIEAIKAALDAPAAPAPVEPLPPAPPPASETPAPV